MAQDPVSAVASWLTPAIPEVPDAADRPLVPGRELTEAKQLTGCASLTSVAPTAADDIDPVLALIAEGNRLAALRIAASGRGDEIYDALPEDIREGKVRVSFSDSEVGRLLGRHSGFTSEAHLHRWVRVHREVATVCVRFDVEKGRIGAEALAAEEAEFDRYIGLDQALAQLRAGQAEIKAIREASGYEAHYREAEALDERADVIFNQICDTPPRTLAGAIAMLELASELASGEDSCPIETKSLINTANAGLRDMQPEAARNSPGDDRILALFREWVDGHRAASAIEDEDEAKNILGPADEAEDTIVSIPATGAAGLAVKAYFYLFFEDGWYASDCAALSGRATDETDDKPRVQLKLGLLKDIVAFAPELAPLADRYIKGLPRENPYRLTSAEREELAEILAEMGYDRATRTWGPGAADRDQKVIGFGEPEEGGAA
jgi:hypothetical protein